MPPSRAWSPAPPSPLGPGTRPSSIRAASPARRPTTDPPRTPTPRTGSPGVNDPPVVILTAPAADEPPRRAETSIPLRHPQPTHLPSTVAGLTDRPLSTASNVRDSSASAFDFMEAMLAPYERDDNMGDSDEELSSEEIVTPVERSPLVQRAGDRRDKPEKVLTDERIKSLEGDVGEEVISFPVPQSKRKTVILFPSPNLEPTKSRSPSIPTQMSQGPKLSQNQPPLGPRIVTHPCLPPMSPNPPQAPRQAYTIPNLPSSGAPVSPHLAAAPSPILSPPRSPFAAPNRSSTSSESITGFDLLKEKKALLRGGDDEVFSPISPRKGRQEGGLRAGVRPRAGVPSTVDFWKRFSMSVSKMEGGQMEKGQSQESEWLSDAQKRRNRIKCLLIVGGVVVAIIAGGIAAGVVLSKSGHDNESGASPLCARAAGGGAAAGASGAGPC